MTSLTSPIASKHGLVATWSIFVRAVAFANAGSRAPDRPAALEQPGAGLTGPTWDPDDEPDDEPDDVTGSSHPASTTPNTTSNTATRALTPMW